MKKLALVLALVLMVSSLTVAYADWTPDKPITILNYVKAGGGMDVTTRKFQEIASKYTDVTIVVDNKPGAGGIIAADYILDQAADNVKQILPFFVRGRISEDMQTIYTTLRQIAYREEVTTDVHFMSIGAYEPFMQAPARMVPARLGCRPGSSRRCSTVREA